MDCPNSFWYSSEANCVPLVKVNTRYKATHTQKRKDFETTPVCAWIYSGTFYAGYPTCCVNRDLNSALSQFPRNGRMYGSTRNAGKDQHFFALKNRNPRETNCLCQVHLYFTWRFVIIVKQESNCLLLQEIVKVVHTHIHTRARAGKIMRRRREISPSWREIKP